jgi:hypothetical protein
VIRLRRANHDLASTGFGLGSGRMTLTDLAPAGFLWCGGRLMLLPNDRTGRIGVAPAGGEVGA